MVEQKQLILCFGLEEHFIMRIYTIRDLVGITQKYILGGYQAKQKKMLVL